MLAYFIIKFESFDVETFAAEVAKIDPNGVFLSLNYVGEIRVLHKAPGLALDPKYRFFTPGHWSANRWFKWPLYWWTMSRILLTVLWHSPVDHFFIVGGDVILWVAQIFKFFGRIRRTTNVLEDWSRPAAHDNLFDKLNKFKIWWNDWLSLVFDTKVIVATQQIDSARNQYWRGRTAKNSVLHDQIWMWFLEVKRNTKTHPPGGNEICILGTMREQFGIERLFEILPDLARHQGLRLRVIGPESEISRDYQKKAEALGLQDFILWRGFVPNSQLEEELKSCFCGLNLLELEQSNSQFVVVGRVVQYLQNLLVPIVSAHSGALVPILKKEKMGVITELSAEALKSAILEAHQNHKTYIQNIERFLRDNPHRLNPRQLIFSPPETQGL